MAIEVKAPNGASISFPDGTPPETISKVMAENFGGPKPDVSKLESGLRGGLQGVSFGLADEGYGALMGAKDWMTGKPFTEAYAKHRDDERAANAKASAANPATFIAGEIGGSVVVPGGASRLGIKSAVTAAGNLGLKARSVAGAKEGAAYGGLYGFGKGEGLEDSAINAGTGAAVGAPLGAVLPAAVDLVKGTVGKITTPIRAAVSPTAVGNEKLAEAAIRDMQVPAAGVRIDEPLQRAADRLQRARQTKPGTMMVDVLGENSRNLLRSAANMPSTGAESLRKTLDARQANQWRRIEADMSTSLANPAEYSSALDQIIANRKAVTGPLFDVAMKAKIKPTDELIEVLQRPGMKSIMERTLNKIKDEGKTLADDQPMEVLHRAKMEIDGLIKGLKRGTENTANWDVRTLTILKHDLLNAIPNPIYKQALKSYAGRSAMEGAAEDGFERALKIPTEDIKKTIANLSTDAERDLWRIGAARAIAGKIRTPNVNHDRTDNVFGSPDIQLRMEGIFADNASRRAFQRNLILEAKMADTRKAVQGNSSSAKQLAQADEAGQAMRPAVAIANAATGRFEQALHYFSRQMQRFSGMTPATANAIIEAAMQKSGRTNTKAWADAMAKAEKEPAYRAEMVRRLIAGAAAETAPRKGKDYHVDDTGTLNVNISPPAP